MEVFTKANQPINIASTKATNRNTVFRCLVFLPLEVPWKKILILNSLPPPPPNAARQALPSTQKEESSVADPHL
jgi:hypothetical protein